MNLKKRLFLANFAAVAIPLLITVFLAFVYLFIYGRFAQGNISFARYQQLSEIEIQFFHNRQNLIQERPEMMEEESKQKELMDQLEQIKGELVILKNDRVLFASREFSQIDLSKLLQAEKGLVGNDKVVINNISYIVQLVDLNYQDGSLAQVILMAPVQGSRSNLMHFLWFIGMAFLLSFLITNFFITGQISKTILTPINNLQRAAAEISKGNLEHQIIEEGDREIQELCRDLEIMRIKLKELIYNQLKYEDNRKMLISSISHDLKTPVTSIKGYVEGILDGVANNPEKIKKYLYTISLKAEQVDKLIDDLVLFSKLDLNQIPFEMRSTNIVLYLQSCLMESEPELERDGIRLEFTNELKSEQFVFLDQEKMKRVIMNIIDNSRKYMGKEEGEEGKIHVRLRETKTSIILEFRDNGPGIAEKDLPFVFDRFYRSDHARTDLKGSGLGLAIGKQIVEGNKGRIWAVSPSEGGTSIIISLSK